MDVTILLPTLNEEDGIGPMIERIRSTCHFDLQIVVADGGSTDKTLERARSAGAILLPISQRGKAKAIGPAFQSIDTPYLVLVDSDMSYDPADIQNVLEALKEHEVCLGSRFMGAIEPGAMSPVNRAGNQALSRLASVLYGRPVSDVCTGLWGFRKEAYKEIIIDSTHFELEANFFAEISRLGLRLAEAPITYRRRSGRSKLMIWDGVNIAAYLARKAFHIK